MFFAKKLFFVYLLSSVKPFYLQLFVRFFSKTISNILFYLLLLLCIEMVYPNHCKHTDFVIVNIITIVHLTQVPRQRNSTLYLGHTFCAGVTRYNQMGLCTLSCSAWFGPHRILVGCLHWYASQLRTQFVLRTVFFKHL